ncbi:hypothetical protein [Paraburkholderia sp. CNPSo 3281]|uniref:hypothetical protein n=1 Tax=Paraburkholderia sp. CNPSo 3281 TaxID=2940933 RepID=UPI0020B885C0|nr:hypothetical protein [Paraburkholderia sp. CNPSo 3281]MCP3715807.1 hypothetical protein [Paraburkholderia sp. CNPSo 3281]
MMGCSFLRHPRFDGRFRARNLRIFEEDHTVLRRVRPVRVPESWQNEVSVKSDALKIAFRQRVRALAEGGWRRARGGAGEPRGHGDCLPDAAHGEHVGAGDGRRPRGAANGRERRDHAGLNAGVASTRSPAPNARLPPEPRARREAQWRGVTGSTAAQYGSAP